MPVASPSMLSATDNDKVICVACAARPNGPGIVRRGAPVVVEGVAGVMVVPVVVVATYNMP